MCAASRSNDKKRSPRRSGNSTARQHPILRGNARELAWSTLSNLNDLGGFAPQRLDQLLRESPLPDIERRLATELVYGIVRREPLLRYLLQLQLHRPWGQVETELRTILLLGSYQLIYARRIPPHAAVNTSVELCARVGRGAARGFVNGVLRSLQRLLTTERTALPSPRSIPVDQNEYLLLNQDQFPDPQTRPVEFFATTFGFPLWLVERWAKRFTFDRLLSLGFRLNEPGKMTLRVNSRKTTREDYLALLLEQGISATPATTTSGIRLEESLSPTRLPSWDEGFVTVQDETAQRAAELLAPNSGQRLWDVCAAPGGKTTHLAELIGDEGRLLATDVHEERLEHICTAAQRLQLKSIEARLIQNVRDVSETFDAILLDVPCSNTGVLGKRPEARWRIQPQDLLELPRIQTEILEGAAKQLRPHGRLVYSTCSIEPEENGDIIRNFLHQHPDWSLLSEQEYIPSDSGDGGYQALLSRHHPHKLSP